MENTSVGPGGGASICLSFCLFGDPPRPVAAVWLHGAPSPAPARAASPARFSALAAALASLSSGPLVHLGLSRPFRPAARLSPTARL